MYLCKIGFGLSLSLHREVVNFIKLDAAVQRKKKDKKEEEKQNRCIS